jgi:hypothetical protein
MTADVKADSSTKRLVHLSAQILDRLDAHRPARARPAVHDSDGSARCPLTTDIVRVVPVSRSGIEEGLSAGRRQCGIQGREHAGKPSSCSGLLDVDPYGLDSMPAG